MTARPGPVAPERATPLRPALVLIGVLLIATNLRAAITSLGPILGLVQADQGLSSVAASVLVSVPLVAFAGCSPIAPKVAAKLGLERSLGAAVLLLAIGILLRSTPPQLLLWTGTALLGVAIAILNVLLPALVKRDFPTRIGPITGTYTAVQSGVAAIAAGVAVPLAGQEAGGWRLSLGVWAGLALIALGVFLPQLRRSAAAPPLLRTTGAARPWTNGLAWQVTLFMGLQSLAFYVLVTWLSSIEQAAGISSVTAGFHQLLFNLCGLVGSLVSSMLIHRLPDQRPVAITGSLLLTAALTGLLVAPGDRGALGGLRRVGRRDHVGVGAVAVWAAYEGLFRRWGVVRDGSVRGLHPRGARADRDRRDSRRGFVLDACARGADRARAGADDVRRAGLSPEDDRLTVWAAVGLRPGAVRRWGGE